MKKTHIRSLLLAALAAALLLSTAYAANGYQTSNVPIGSSSEVVMEGSIEPTLMTVVLPAYIPFTVSRALEGTNKVISPRITMSNLSGVPVGVTVTENRVDLRNLQGTTWNSTGNPGSQQIAIGFQPETVENQMPTSLNQTKWLSEGRQNLALADLYSYSNSTVYVVGTLGDQVPEEGSFTVIPTLVVSRS